MKLHITIKQHDGQSFDFKCATEKLDIFSETFRYNLASPDELCIPWTEVKELHIKTLTDE